MKNWKTTLAGLLTAIGVYLITINEPSWVHTVGQGLSAAGALLMGIFAKDSNVTGGTTKQ